MFNLVQLDSELVTMETQLTIIKTFKIGNFIVTKNNLKDEFPTKLLLLINIIADIAGPQFCKCT